MQLLTTPWPIGAALIRMITGCLLIYHGSELFMPDKMQGYSQWMNDLHYPMPAVAAHAGKAAELLGGISLLLGVWVRIFSVPLILTLLLITFTMGHGKVFTDDQHPFVLALLCLAFFFNGAGIWSIDAAKDKKSQSPT